MKNVNQVTPVIDKPNKAKELTHEQIEKLKKAKQKQINEGGVVLK